MILKWYEFGKWSHITSRARFILDVKVKFDKLDIQVGMFLEINKDSLYTHELFIYQLPYLGIFLYCFIWIAYVIYKKN